MLLETINSHPRDKRIEFNEAEHFYTVDSRRVVGSCSSLWASCFSKFDAEGTARRLVRRHSNHDAIESSDAVDDAFWRWKYAYAYETLVKRTSASDTVRILEAKGCSSFDFCDQDNGYRRLFWHLRESGVSCFDGQAKALTALWSALGERASSRGTFVHRQAELHCNDEPYEDGHEMSQYLRFRSEHPHLRPYRTEWSVFSYAHGGAHIVAGQIDGLFVNEKNDTFEMIDYKVTAHELSPENPYRKYGEEPFEHVPDTPWGHYCVQQNIYAYILKRDYGINVERCRLLRVHDAIENYQLVNVMDLSSSVAHLFDKCALSTKINVVQTPRVRWRRLAVALKIIFTFKKLCTT